MPHFLRERAEPRNCIFIKFNQGKIIDAITGAIFLHHEYFSDMNQKISINLMNFKSKLSRQLIQTLF